MGSMTLLVKPKKTRELGLLRAELQQHAREHSAARAVRENRGLGERLIEAAMRGDRDGNGTISNAEAPSWLRRSFKRVDSNSNGQIDRKELERAVSRLRGGR